MAEEHPGRVGAGSYVIAGLGFIPLIGVIFAAVAIVIGFVKLRAGGKWLIVLGCLGISVTVGIYGTLFYKGFVERGGVFDGLRATLAETLVTDLVKSIEYYKLINGAYPATLLDLKGSANAASFMTIYDPTLMLQTPFFYQVTEDATHYHLLGVGADRKPFTADDILPGLSAAERANTGLLINEPAPPTEPGSVEI